MSDWNRYLERKLALDLTVEEHRLADALARSLLGFQQLAERLGEDLLRQRARMHGRSFDRARAGLAEKGLVRVTPPESPGRGHRTLYELLLDETPAEEREIPESPALEQEIPKKPPQKSGSLSTQTPAETPAPERARIEEGGEKEHGAAVLPPPARERDGGGEDLEPEPFTEAVALLGLTEAQRQLARRAFDEDERGFLRVVKDARRSGHHPAALLVSKLRRGDHRGKAGRLGVTIAEILEQPQGLPSTESAAEPAPRRQRRIIDYCWKCGEKAEMHRNWLCEKCAQADEPTVLAEAAALVEAGVLEELR